MKLLNQKEQHIAYTREDAEKVVVNAKENPALIMNKISEKHNAKAVNIFWWI